MIFETSHGNMAPDHLRCVGTGSIWPCSWASFAVSWGDQDTAFPLCFLHIAVHSKLFQKNGVSCEGTF